MNQKITINSKIIEMTGEGLIWIEEDRLLCASDIHFEKSTFFSQFATLLPPYDSDNNLERLSAAIKKYRPEIFIALGDSFHDVRAAERMNENIIKQLNELISQVKDWRWITGNHDPEIASVFNGKACVETEVNGVSFCHELSGNRNRIEISGHFHPKASVFIKGNSVTAPCYVKDGNRIIMPAFGKYTGGFYTNNLVRLNIINENSEIYLLYKNGVYTAN